MPMADLDDLVRSTYGDPPVDLAARDRALVRLRADIAEAQPRQKLDVVPSKLVSWRLATLVVAIGAVLLCALLATGVSTPAAAAGLQRMESLNAATPATTSVTTEEQHSVTQTYLDRGSFTLVVRTSVQRSVQPDGTITQTDTYEDVQFASDADRTTWMSLGSPQIPQVGDRDTERIGPSDQDWFDPSSVSTNASKLLEALETGKVASRWQGQSGIFVLIGALLADPRVNRGQRAALFQVAASLDGVQAEGSMTDPLGRDGEAYSVVADGLQQTLIFDPATGQPLATLGQAGGASAAEWLAFEYPG
jgi:hypothetical protein